MSSFSGSEQSFALAALTPAESVQPAPATLPAGRLEVTAQDLWLQPLSTPRQLAGIEHLRRQIELPAAVRADPAFAALEKKGTAPDWSLRFDGVTPPSAP